MSWAEVEAAALVYGRPMAPVAYLPCCGTLRHVPALLERGVERLVAVDLSLASLTDRVDTRTRRSNPVPGTAMSILRFTSEIRNAQTGELIVEAHGYDKLVVPDALLAEQFADAGLKLANAGRVADLSPYHRERIRRAGDLGMLGEPDCFYRAVNETTKAIRVVGRSRRPSPSSSPSSGAGSTRSYGCCSVAVAATTAASATEVSG